MFAKTIHPSPSMRKTFSLYTYIPIHNKLFLYTCEFKTLSLYINTVYIQTLSLFKDFLFPFSTYTRGLYKNFFIYTHCSHTRISFHTLFTPTQNLSIHFLHIKTLFFSSYIDTTFVHNASFFFYSWCYHDFCSFYS